MLFLVVRMIIDIGQPLQEYFICGVLDVKNGRATVRNNVKTDFHLELMR